MGDVLRRYGVYAALLWRSSRRWTLIGAVVTLVSGVVPIAIILLSGALIGSILDGISSRTLWLLGGLVAALIAKAALTLCEKVVSRILTTRYLVTVHDIVASASLRPAHIDHLENPQMAGKFAAVADGMREGSFLYGVSSTILVASFRIRAVGAAITLASFRWWAPLMLMLGWFTLGWAFNRWLAAAMDQLVQVTGSDRRRAEYLRQLMMGPSAAKEIRTVGLHSYLGQRYTRTWFAAMTPIWRSRRRSFRPLGVAVTVMLVTHVAVLAVLGQDAYSGAISVGAIAIFLQAIYALENFGPQGDPQTFLTRATSLAHHVHEIEAEVVNDEARMPALVSGPSDIELRDVSFTYPSRDMPTLSGLSLSIPAGQSIAVVGENGAGKSTLIKLLCGLYSPDSGEIGIGGKVAVIFQDFVRYHLPLRENVGFGNLASMHDEPAMRRALTDAAGLDVLDRLDHGWDTVLSATYEGGTDLSGGQWQRVALARALAALDGGAGVLILDEPTASLDVRAEAELFDRFLQVTRGATTILVSHRLSSVRHADRIVVLADGHVVEDGTHDELMATDGRYARMFTLQAQRFAMNGSDSDA